METTTEQLRLPVPDAVVDHVSAVLHRPERASGPSVLLVPGAGGDLDGAGLVALADVLARHGCPTVRANLPYREAGRRSPPRADRCVPDYRAVFEAARATAGPDRPWVAGGKSYGGRVGSMAAAQGMGCAGLLFYGYPLHPPGKQERLRVDHWADIGVPCLFLQGARDPFCDPGLLDANVGTLAGGAHVELVEGGDHSLRVAGAHAPDGRPRAPAVVLEELAGSVVAWLHGLVDEG